MTMAAKPPAGPDASADLELLTPPRVGELLGVSVHTLARWRRLEKGPPFVRVSAIRVGYPRGRLRAWLDARLEKQ